MISRTVTEPISESFYHAGAHRLTPTPKNPMVLVKRPKYKGCVPDPGGSGLHAVIHAHQFPPDRGVSRPTHLPLTVDGLQQRCPSF